MNQRSETYMQSHDMDFIFMAHGHLIHCATNGALIPKEARNIKSLNAICKQIRLSENRFTVDDLTINGERINSIIEAQRNLIAQFNNRHRNDNTETSIEISDELIRSNYLSSFIGIAMKGLHSYDYICSTVTDKGIIKETFELVAKPKDELIPEYNCIHILGDIEAPDLSDIVSVTGNQLEILIEPIIVHAQSKCAFSND